MAKKIMFLFGAGASHGCGESVIPYNPPLGNDLYNKLVSDSNSLYWRTTKFPYNLTKEFSINFESAFSKLVDYYESNIVREGSFNL